MNDIKFDQIRATPPAYLVELDTIPEEAHLTFLNEDELTVYQNFIIDKRKRQWLGGRMTAKKAVSCFLDGADIWRRISIESSSSGKPMVKLAQRPCKIHLSISHSAGVAAAIASNTHPCGIDIQQVGDKVVKVASRFLSPGEESLLESLTGSARERLTLLWAAKESIRKIADDPWHLPGFQEIILQKIVQKDKWNVLECRCGDNPISCRVKIYGEYGLSIAQRP